MPDIVEKMKHSTIQHGSHNNRIYLMDLDRRDYPIIFSSLDSLAQKKDYTKIFAKVPFWAFKKAQEYEYVIEAEIPGLFNNSDDGLFLSKFLDKTRQHINSKERKKIKEVYQKFQTYTNQSISNTFLNDVSVRRLTENDANNLAQLYKLVFQSYPFPIYNATYLKKMMSEHVHYYGIFQNEELVAASAAEMNPNQKYVEMTDFATRKDKRGKNYALFLLSHMEKEMKIQKIKTAFTIARAVSFGMNITFAKAGYTFSGLLKNNTEIAGTLESMNVFYKKL